MIEADPSLLAATSSPAYAPERQTAATGLHAAVYARQPEVARLLLDAGIEIEARTTEGRTALHDSIEFGRDEITALLIERGATVDICSAAILGKLERVRELLDEAPRLANDRSTGLSPLGWASFGNQVGTATELLDRGARMDDEELLCAASVGHVDVGRLLLDRGADPHALGRGGGNALHVAAAMRYTHDSRPFIEMLIERGIDPHATTADGRTALQIAEQKEREQRKAAPSGCGRRRYAEVARLLREH